MLRLAVPIIEHFLKDVEGHKGDYKGFGAIGVAIQMASNRSLRHYLGMQPDQTGVVIASIMPLSGARYVRV